MKFDVSAGLITLALAGCWTGNDAPLAPVDVDPLQPISPIRVSSLGLVRVTPRDEPPMDAWLVRVVVADRGADQRWTLDARTLALECSPEDRVWPVLANGDFQTMPIAIVEPEHAKTVDVYFPWPCPSPGLAPTMLAWHATTPGWKFDGHAHLEPPRSTDAIARSVGKRRYWWSDPAYPWRNVEQRDGFIVPRAPEDATARLGSVFATSRP